MSRSNPPPSLAAFRPRRSLVLPFLVVAMPALFALYTVGEPACRPLCFQPSPSGYALVGSTLVGAYAVAGVVVSALRLETRWRPNRVLRRAVAPTTLTIGLLAAFFGGYLLFLTADALDVAEPLWKPVVLPLTGVLFLPVWLLYGATFVLAVSVGTVSPPVTALVRTVVLVGGFGLAGIWQFALATLLSEAVGASPPADGEDETLTSGRRHG